VLVQAQANGTSRVGTTMSAYFFALHHATLPADEYWDRKMWKFWTSASFILLDWFIL